MTGSEVAKGEFEIKMTPQEDAGFEAGRMTLDKTYKGDLAGQGTGQMLSHRSAVQGSAAYVAIELFSGNLQGREGSFALQHVGVMDRGTPSLRVTVVPDSGTGGLEGLKGEMTIDQSKGNHEYEFRYSIEVK